MPLPGWAILICPCGVDNACVGSEFENEAEVSRELDVDMELVIQFVECINILESTL